MKWIGASKEINFISNQRLKATIDKYMNRKRE
jgi:hypothetical protein